MSAIDAYDIITAIAQGDYAERIALALNEHKHQRAGELMAEAVLADRLDRSERQRMSDLLNDWAAGMRGRS